METVRIETTQNIGLDFQMATLWQRILAFLVDLAVIFAFMVAVGTMASIGNLGSTADTIIILAISASYLYFLLSELLMNGQTLGKRALGIRVVKLDGSRPGLAAYLLRWVMIPLDFGTSGSVAITLIIFTQQGQRLGDLLAGTTVVKSKSRQHHLDYHRAHLREVEREKEYEPRYPQAIRLESHELQLIERALTAFRQRGHRDPVMRLQKQLARKLDIETEDPPLRFLKTLRKDYYHYAQQQ